MICQKYRKSYKNIKKLLNSKHLILDSLLGRSPILFALSSFCAFYTR